MVYITKVSYTQTPILTYSQILRESLDDTDPFEIVDQSHFQNNQARILNLLF